MSGEPSDTEPRYDPFDPFLPSEITLSALQSPLDGMLTDPWVVSVSRWSSNQPLFKIESDLKNEYSEAQSSPDNIRWRGTGQKLIISDTIDMLPDGETIVSKRVPGWLRGLYAIALIIAPVFIFVAPWVAALIYFLLSVILPSHGTRPPIPNMNLAGRTTSGIPGVCMILAMFAIFMTVSANLDLLIVELAMIIGIATQVAILYIENGIPRIETDISEIVFYIPLFGILLTLTYLTFFFLLVWLFGAQFLYMEAWQGFFARNLSQGKASILSDMVGGIPNYSLGAQLSPRQVKLLFLDGISGFIPNFAVILVLLSVFIIWTAWRLEVLLSRVRLTGFSTSGRKLILVGTVVANIFVYVAFAIALSILNYGLTGHSVLPPSSFAPIVDFYTAGDSPSGIAFLRGIYQAFDLIFSGSDVIPARVATLTFFSILLWPIVLIGVYSVSTLIGRPLIGYWMIRQGRTLSPDRHHGSLENDINIRVVDLDGCVDVRPISFFGLRKYIVVSEAVMEVIGDSQDELTAVLSHEEYHLNNQDHQFIATLLAVGIGGRNAALAFFDYPTIEREADIYAKNQTDFLTVSTAIRKLYNHSAKQHRQRIQNPFVEPGFVGLDIRFLVRTLRYQVVTADLSVTDTYIRIRSAVRWIDLVMGAQRRILFGTVLVNSAHMHPKDRIQRLEHAID